MGGNEVGRMSEDDRRDVAHVGAVDVETSMLPVASCTNRRDSTESEMER